MKRQMWLFSVLALCCAGGLLGGCDSDSGETTCFSQADCPLGQYCDLVEGVCKWGVCVPNCTGLECGLDPVCGLSCGDCVAPETCNAATGQCECVPVCTGRECGPDPVCGQSCGTCEANETCDPSGQCQAGCVPSCAGKECGSDGCGGSCGTCEAGEVCDQDGICQACTPDCTNKECGDDGCGGSCGTCGANEICDASHQCVPVCTPDCTNKECGDDGCGGSCGTCTVAGEVCVIATGQCEACTPDCTGRVCGPDPVCGSSCGDCLDHEVCVDGVCECVPDCVGRECGDDGCGGSCGTCTPPETCDPAGQCACIPDCTGRECGLDPVCGTSCGTCGVDEVCTMDGTCVGGCTPDCTGRECGPDPVCNTSCGTCTAPEVCDASGQCVCVPDCAGLECGPDPVCGQSCGTCTAPETCDASGQCVCVPACAGLECGPDPVCGQSCGTCTAPEICDPNGLCVCVPDCGIRECGPDPVCGQSCGTCAAGETCDANGQCQGAGGLLGDPCPYNNVNTDAVACDDTQGLFCVGADENTSATCALDADCVALGYPENYNPDCVTGATTGCGFSFCSQLCDAGGGCPAGFDPYTDASGNCFCIPACVPDCAGRECGDDGCGGSCGTCPTGEACDANGICQPGQAGALGDPCPFGNVNATALACDDTLGLFCVGVPEDAAYPCTTEQECIDQGFPANWNPDCVTGVTTGCGASFCSQLCDAGGGCPAGYDPYTDTSGNCFCIPGGTCTPDCTGRECGDDGCGGSCGTCPTGETCDANGQCVTGGLGQHGDLCLDPAECEAGLDCISLGGASGYCASQCDCDTGTGCPTVTPPTECMWWDGASTCWCGYQCPSQSAIECPNGGVGWSCDNFGDAANPFWACNPQGTCTPDCTGRECGDDGCGGSCGTCPTGETCDANGQCIACTPDCTGRECGDDGCGGSCGTCPTGETCDANGQCVVGTCSEILLDGSFEATGAGGADWTVFSSAYGTPLWQDAAYAHSGEWEVFVGGGAADDAWVEQALTIPAGTATASVYMWTGGCVAGDYFEITVDGAQVIRVEGTDANYTAGYALVSVDISAYADGASHAIRLHGVVTTAAAAILLDDASVYSCPGTCTPDCTGRECGDDGCGGSCGTCPTGETCDANGLCQAAAGNLMLSEVLYDVTGGDDGLEWIEIFNGTANPIDLSTYSLGNGGGDYLNSVVQLSGTIPAGGCFLVGGPNGGPTYDQVFNFDPDLENSGNAADGVALFNIPAASLTAASVPIDAVIYGTNNSNNLLDETGAPGNVDVGDAPTNSSIERTTAGWAIQAAPTPGVCNLP